MGNVIHILNKRVDGLISGSAGIVAGLVGQNLNIGELTATKVVTNIVSQSISLATGSNIFGDEQTDTHQITGSLQLTSSFALIKTQSPSGDVLTVNVCGQDKVTINNDGTLVVKEVATLPTGEKGALSVSGSNFFVYL